MLNQVLSFSREVYRGGHKGIFGPIAMIRHLYNARTDQRPVVRIIGSSAQSNQVYQDKVVPVLREIKTGLLDLRDRVEIQGGVSLLGIDHLLSNRFYRQMPVSGVVAWAFPRIEIKCVDGSAHLFSNGINGSTYREKKRLLETFAGCALLVEGKLTERGLTFLDPHFTLHGKAVQRMSIGTDDYLCAELDRLVISGTNWDRTCELYQEDLVALVVLGGGDFSFNEAIVANAMGKRVLCVDPDILPNEAKPGQPSASTRLVREARYPAYDAAGIVEAIRDEVLQQQPRAIQFR